MRTIKTLLLTITACLTFLSCQSQDAQLKEGDKAPDFTLVGDDGKSVKLSDYAGKNVVLYFYPKDQTPGCTMEACSMRDNLNSIQSNNAIVIGVSIDSPESHKAFKDKQKLPFLLLSDKDKVVSRQYSGLNPIGMAKRVTFIIGKDGLIKKVFRNVDPPEHYKEVLAALSTLK